MFQAKIDVKDIKEITNLVLTLVSECKFEVSSDGVVIKAVDPAHVAMLILDIDKDAFVEFNSEEDELGVELDKVRDILKLASSSDIIEMKKEDNKLVFTLKTLLRSMGLIDTSSFTVPKIPNLALPSKVVVPKIEFENGIKSAESISDSVILKLNDTEFEIFAEGDNDLSKLPLPKDMLSVIECDDPVKSAYPLDYLIKLMRAIDYAKELTIYLGNDYPMKLEFEVANGKGKAMFLLAPRIES